MTATILTTEEIRNCEGRDYNPSVWDKNIDRMLQDYSDVVFYHVPKGDSYDYDRYFVEYTLPEGLRLFGAFGYSGAMTSGGFYRLDKQAVTGEGKTYADLMTLVSEGRTEESHQLAQQLATTKKYSISLGKFPFEVNGEVKMTAIGTSPEARQWMIDRSKSGLTFSKGL